MDDCGAVGQACTPTGAPHCGPQSCVRGNDPEFRCTAEGVSQICAGVYETYAPCVAEGGTCRASTGRCEVTAACNLWQERCNGNRIERCSEGPAWALLLDCAFTGQTCDDQLEVRCAGEPRCITGELRCTQDRVEVCSNGGFVVAQDCVAEGMGCREGACAPISCQSGAIECVGEVAMVCEAGTFFATDCAAEGKICEPTRTPPCRTVCGDGRLRCNGDQLQTCTGGLYQTIETCASGCEQSPQGGACR